MRSPYPPLQWNASAPFSSIFVCDKDHIAALAAIPYFLFFLSVDPLKTTFKGTCKVFVDEIDAPDAKFLFILQRITSAIAQP